MNYFIEKLLKFDKDCQLPSLLHIQTEVKQSASSFPSFGCREYVSDLMRQYTIQMQDYPDLCQKDQELAFFIYSHQKQRLNIFALEEVKRKPLKKKNIRKSTKPKQTNSKICTCCNAVYQIKHKCQHNLCDQNCLRFKKSFTCKRNRQIRLKPQQQSCQKEFDQKELSQDSPSSQQLSEQLAQSSYLPNAQKQNEDQGDFNNSSEWQAKSNLVGREESIAQKSKKQSLEQEDQEGSEMKIQQSKDGIKDSMNDGIKDSIKDGTIKKNTQNTKKRRVKKSHHQKLESWKSDQKHQSQFLPDYSEQKRRHRRRSRGLKRSQRLRHSLAESPETPPKSPRVARSLLADEINRSPSAIRHQVSKKNSFRLLPLNRVTFV